MKLILIRHGRTEANERHAYLGSTDQPITDSSAVMLKSRAAAGAYPGLKGFRVCTSGLRRTEDTLHCICGNVDHEILPAFREIDFGCFEGRTYEELKETPEYQAWITGGETACCPDGESFAEMKERVLTGLKQVLSEDRDTVIFTHGGPCAVCMEALFPGEHRNFYEWNPHHGEGYEIRIRDGKALEYSVF